MPHEDEIERNLFAFQSQVPGLIDEFRDQYAVIRQQEVVGIYARLSQALSSAGERFADGLFSIQKVTDKPIDLGFFSHASDSR
ncbi:hypothetical protein [Tsuneonella sp. HG222]